MQPTDQNTQIINYKQATELYLFDLDHTLLPIDSDKTWGQFLIKEGIVGQDYHDKNHQFYLDYQKGNLDVHSFLEFVFAVLAKHSRAKLLNLQQQYIKTCIMPNLKPSALNLVASKRHANSICLLVTATNSFVTRPIAELFGFAGHELIASEPETLDLKPWAETDANFSGKINGLPCYRANKIHKIEAWLQNYDLLKTQFSHIEAYSDSFNDIPMLSWAHKAFATNADETLTAYAKSQNWQFLSLFA